MLCGFAIALVYEATAEQIARNRTALLEEAVARVLPGATHFQGYWLIHDALAPAGVDEASFIAGYDSSGALVGVGLPASIMGYQDNIGMLFGYDPVGERLTGFVVLESRETPGLGSKIGTASAFLRSLSALDVRLDGTTLANAVTLTTRGTERRPYEVDGVTGATVSSRAVVQAINNTAARLAAIRARLGALREQPSGHHDAG
jgi:electron transport complex protein RnfG